MSLPSHKDTIYFGYGSNLWLYQMSQRCPKSKYLGVARLKGYQWIINDRGYANVIEVKENENTGQVTDTSQAKPNQTEEDSEAASSKYDKVVFGLVYSLTSTDEAQLDKNEGVPRAYTKEYLHCDFWSAGHPSAPEENHKKVDTTEPPTSTRDMLVYIDRKRVTPDKPRQEYIHRMNSGIADALKLGVPEAYVEDVMRTYIPEMSQDETRKMEDFAKDQAKEFKDESGVIQR